jgi:hypothetical protein
MSRYRSKWHKWSRAVRVARRLARIGIDPADPYTANDSAYHRYLWLVDKGARLVPHSAMPPLAVQCVRVRGYLTMRGMGWRDARV